MHTVIIALLLFLAYPSSASAGWFQDQEAAIAAINGAGAPSPSWDMEIYFEGTADGTTYTAGGNDAGFTTATLSAAGLVDTTNDLITIDASDEYISFPITAKDIFDSAGGALEARVNCTATTNVNQLFEAWVTDSVDYFHYTINGNNTILSRHEGQNSKNDLTTSAAIADNQDFIIQIKWLATGSNTTDILSIRIDINADGDFADANEGWQDTVDVDAVRPFTTEPADIKIGNLNFEYGTTDSCTVTHFKIATNHTVPDL